VSDDPIDDIRCAYEARIARLTREREKLRRLLAEKGQPRPGNIEHVAPPPRPSKDVVDSALVAVRDQDAPSFQEVVLADELDALRLERSALQTELARWRVSGTKLLEGRVQDQEKLYAVRVENALLRAEGKGLCAQCGFPCSVIDETLALQTTVDSQRILIEALNQTTHDDGVKLTELMSRETDVEGLTHMLMDLREAAVAFAFIAVHTSTQLRSTATLEALRTEANRCKPDGAAEIRPGFEHA
jgi:hypothetical protein